MVTIIHIDLTKHSFRLGSKVNRESIGRINGVLREDLLLWLG